MSVFTKFVLGEYKHSTFSCDFQIIIIIMMIIIIMIIIIIIIIIIRNSKCRLCQQFYETIDHIIPACPILAKEQCIKRHDRVCAHYTSTYARKQG